MTILVYVAVLFAQVALSLFVGGIVWCAVSLIDAEAARYMAMFAFMVEFVHTRYWSDIDLDEIQEEADGH
jgi:hypothetical protein